MSHVLPLMYLQYSRGQAVGCCEYNLWMYQRASTLVNIQLLWVLIHRFLSQDGNHPWKFSKLGFTVIGTSYAESYAIRITMATPSPLLWFWCDRFSHCIRLLTAYIEVLLTGSILDPARSLLRIKWLQVS